MHATVLHTDLIAAVSAAATALPSRPPHPVLGGMLLEQSHVELKISAYDYETSASARINAEGGDSTGVVVSGRLLAQVAKLLPKKPVELTARDGELLVEAGRSRFTLPLMEAGDFPKMPEIEGFDGIATGPDFAAAVAYADAAALKDLALAAKQNLTGILLENDSDSAMLNVVATDSHRIHWAKAGFKAIDTPSAVGVLVPSKVLASVAGAMASDSDGVFLSLRQLFGISGNGMQRTSATIDQKFPPYRKVFDKTAVGTLDVNSIELIDALRRTSALHATKHVVIEPTDDDTVRISTNDASDGGAIEEIDVEMAGDPPTLVINGAFLADAIAGVKQETITLTLTGEVSPVFGNLDGTTKFAVMPVRTQ
jgi:DNA polymerase-3 subunit beta